MIVRDYINSDKKIVITFINDMINASVEENDLSDYFSSYYSKFILENESNEVVGFALMNDKFIEGSDKISEIIFFYIINSFRKQGLGSFLLNDIEKKYLSLEYKSLITKINTNNIISNIFFLKNGYKFESRLNDLNNGNDYYFLRKFLRVGNSFSRP